jgi:hypothetical protein
MSFGYLHPCIVLLPSRFGGSQFKTCDTHIDLKYINHLDVSLMSHARKWPKRLIGYVRVSTKAQDLSRQHQMLRAHGCKAIYADKASGEPNASAFASSPAPERAAGLPCVMA